MEWMDTISHEVHEEKVPKNKGCLGSVAESRKYRYLELA